MVKCIFEGGMKMSESKVYSYTFSGSSSELVNEIRKNEIFFSNDKESDLHLFNVSDNSIALGIQRGGHSGGYFYDANIVTKDNETIIEGTITFHKSDISDTSYENKKFSDYLVDILAYILFGFLILIFIVPILIFIIYDFIVNRLIKRKKKVNYKKQREENINIFFSDYLNCRINSN